MSKRHTSSRVIVVFIILGVVLVVSALLARVLISPQNLTEPPKVMVLTEKTPAFSLDALPLAGHDSVAWASEPFNKPVLVNFMASWCAPCVAELPFLRTLSAHVPIYGVAYADTAEAMTAWLTRHEVTYVTVGLDQQGRTAVAWGLRGVPESFLLDASGAIIFHHRGPLTSANVAEIEALLKAMSS
ncbi:MAG: redoxin family protein [Pseudomonadota bacterium]